MDGKGHAVVIGSGTAGLSAARVLARFMERVTVIERNWTPHGGQQRPGILQARHPHSLTPAAEAGLEHLFPGIGHDLTRAGAVRIRIPQDILVHGPTGWLLPGKTKTSLLSAGRDLMDAVLRERLHAEAKVDFLHGHEVVALHPGRNHTITGVWTRARSRGTPKNPGPRRLLPAQFVVDASGRSFQAARWLAELGYPRPVETVVRSRASYACALLAPPAGHISSWKSLLFTAAPGTPSPQGQLTLVEDGRWSLSLRCGQGTAPPTDHAGLIRTAAALPHPLLHDVIATAAPLGPVHTCTRTDSHWRHIERLRHWPDQFLVTGDALAGINPAHGHGMTLAIHSALILEHTLKRHGTTTGLSHQLHRTLARHIGATWRQNTRTMQPTADTQNKPATWRERLTKRTATHTETTTTTDAHTAMLLPEQTQTPTPHSPLDPRAPRTART
ncbi:NAD(P)/FAD-dependent oxidoreductase [Streptomyces triticiradicis]